MLWWAPAYPTVQYPTILEGEIWGPIRCESLDGSELILPAVPDGSTKFFNFKPFQQNGKTWGVTHLQFLSPKGWIKTDPDCYHLWNMWKLKQKDANGGWIPGSEFGIYYRKPFSWRWQIDPKNPWQWTKGFLGAHFD